MKVEDYFENRDNFEQLIKSFFDYLCMKELEIYNEFSFQHELGIFLRDEMRTKCEDGAEYKIEFERNARKDFGVVYYRTFEYDKMKKEIDLVIYKKDHSKNYAIELKYPLNRQYPEQMFSFIRDIRFMQELVNQKKFQRTYCITLVWAVGRGKPFFMGNQESDRGIDIYKYFRGQEKEKITGKIMKPTGSNKYFIDLGDKEYSIVWRDCQIAFKYDYSSRKNRKCKYYIVECK